MWRTFNRLLRTIFWRVLLVSPQLWNLWESKGSLYRDLGFPLEWLFSCIFTSHNLADLHPNLCPTGNPQPRKLPHTLTRLRASSAKREINMNVPHSAAFVSCLVLNHSTVLSNMFSIPLPTQDFKSTVCGRDSLARTQLKLWQRSGELSLRQGLSLDKELEPAPYPLSLPLTKLGLQVWAMTSFLHGIWTQIPMHIRLVLTHLSHLLNPSRNILSFKLNTF